MSGHTSGYQTGTITYTETWFWWNPCSCGDVTPDWLWQYDITAAAGDSGGPVFLTDGYGSAVLLGIHNGGSSGTKLMTGISTAIASSQVTPCTTSNCHQ
jgi:hypothetical protein